MTISTGCRVKYCLMGSSSAAEMTPGGIGLRLCHVDADGNDDDDDDCLVSLGMETVLEVEGRRALLRESGAL